MPKFSTLSVFLLLRNSSGVCACNTALNSIAEIHSKYLILNIFNFPYSDINANVQTDPPGAIMRPAKRFGLLPPMPDRIVTYCTPLCV